MIVLSEDQTISTNMFFFELFHINPMKMVISFTTAPDATEGVYFIFIFDLL